MIPYTDLLRYMLLPLIFGSYIFTFAIYRMMRRQLDEILVNHLVHAKQEREAWERRIEGALRKVGIDPGAS